jgi:hypothetical protein
MEKLHQQQGSSTPICAVKATHARSRFALGSGSVMGNENRRQASQRVLQPSLLTHPPRRVGKRLVQ